MSYDEYTASRLLFLLRAPGVRCDLVCLIVTLDVKLLLSWLDLLRAATTHTVTIGTKARASNTAPPVSSTAAAMYAAPVYR